MTKYIKIQTLLEVDHYRSYSVFRIISHHKKPKHPYNQINFYDIFFKAN